MPNANPRPKAKAAEPSTDAPHDEKRRQRVQATYQETLPQAEILRHALTAEHENLGRIARHLARQPLERVVILGCGDSWFSGVGVRLGLEYLLGLPVEPMQALDFGLYYGGHAGPRTLVIGISSGGNTPAVMEGLRRAAAKGACTLGVSNNLGTPVMTTFDHAILVRAARKGWPTQASTATMGILLALGLEIARAGQKLPLGELEAWAQAFEQVPALIDQVIERAQTPMQALAERLGGARFLFFCGGGPHFATAAFGAAKVKELCPIHATAIPLEEFHHYRSLKPEDPLILVAPDRASHARALDTAEVGRYDGGWIATLVPEAEREIAAAAQWSLHLPDVAPAFGPLVYSPALHLFAYYLAMEKFKLGLSYTPAFAP